MVRAILLSFWLVGATGLRQIAECCALMPSTTSGATIEQAACGASGGRPVAPVDLTLCGHRLFAWRVEPKNRSPRSYD